ncbi:MAG: signal recognition particle-docking protein FtsY [Dehalococcoidia bacterium]|nr:signal recognition particle-docking protein FtsY [Dehalococcoidia bacterium]
MSPESSMSDLFKCTEQGVKRSREGFFSKISGLFNRSKIEDSTWEELEEILISADVGFETTGKLLARVKKRVKDQKITDGEAVRSALKDEMAGMLDVAAKAAAGPDGNTKIILLVGVNGAGKTTSIAKLASEYKSSGRKVLLGAADTFRAAAIDQLKLWGQRIGVDVIAQQPGADPGAVVFDTLQAAQNRHADIVIIDTAGRLQTKHNLMDELKKIRKVAGKYEASQEVLLVIDATTGQNGLSQAHSFTEATDVTGIFLSKLDGTAKGGIVLAICDSLQIPIRYIGTGETVEDIAPFDARSFVDAIFE